MVPALMCSFGKHCSGSCLVSAVIPLSGIDLSPLIALAGLRRDLNNSQARRNQQLIRSLAVCQTCGDTCPTHPDACTGWMLMRLLQDPT